MRALKTPDMVSWEITENCNMRCKHCSNAINGKPISLSTRECMSIIDRIAEEHIFKVGIEGGEPFCRADIIEIIQYLNSKKIIPTIATNGTLLDYEMIKKLQSCEIDNIQVSVDGSSADKYSHLRKNANIFYTVTGNIKNAVQHGLPISIAMVVSKNTYKDIPNMVSLAKKLNVKRVRFIDFIPSGRGQFEECLSQEEIKEAYKLMYESSGNGIEIIMPNKIMTNVTKKNNISLLGMINDSGCFGCEAGSVLAHVRANGDIYPCVFFRSPEFCAGNILRDAFSDIWDNSNIMKEFRKLGKLPEKCERCEFSLSCMGGCRAYAYFTKGNIAAEDERCWRE